MKCVAVVPMKLVNKRMPGKNIKSFTNGKPLCSYILETLSQIESIDEVYVYCSDDVIKNYLPDNVKYLKRPISLDTDETTMNNVLRFFAEVVDSDIYLLAHATAPFISKERIESGISAVLFDGYDSSFSVLPHQEFIWEDGKPKNYSPDCIPRTQDLKPVYTETCGFYCFTKDLIMKHNRRIGYNPLLVEVTGIEAIDIDTPEDFRVADAVYNYVYGGGGGTKVQSITVSSYYLAEV